MWLRNIDLSEVAHASSLADVNVTNNVIIVNVTGNISALISRIKCNMLVISGISLSTEDTVALVQGMQTNAMWWRWSLVVALWSSTWTLSSPTMGAVSVGLCSVMARLGRGTGTSWPPGGRPWAGAW